MDQQATWISKLFITLAILIMLGILLLHSFILAHNIKMQTTMTDNIINNKRDYTLLMSLIKTSQVLPKDHLDVFNNLSHYDLKINGYNIEVNVSDTPKWPIHLRGNVNSQTIYKFVKKDSAHVQVSYLMKNNQWLNYAEIRYLTAYKLTAILFFVEMLLIMILLFYGWSVYRLKLPLKKFKASAERLGIDFKASPIRETGPALVRETSRAMNIMQERIQELIKNRTQLLATISHDLKTPITRLQLRAELLENEEIGQKITEDLDEMQNMINGILSFSRNDVFHEIKTKFDLVSLLFTVCDDFNDLGHNVVIESNAGSCNIYGRRIALKRCYSNIIQNATKYGKMAKVFIDKTENTIKIIVEDEGPGIPEKELTRVFEAFYRVESASSKLSTGTGLGLTVAKEVVNDHNGTIHLINMHPIGLRVIVELPLVLLQPVSE